MSHNWSAVTALVFNALIFGVSWWPFRELDSRGLHSLWVTAFSYAIVVLGIFLWRPGALRLVLTNKSLLVLFAAAGLTNSSFNWGVLVGDVIRVVLLFYLMPVWAILLGRWVLGEAITRGAVLRIVMALAGAALILYKPDMGLPLPQTGGEWLGLSGGFFFAVTNIMLKQQHDAPTEAKMLAMFAGGTIIPASLALLMMQLGHVQAPGPVGQWLVGLVGFAIVMIAANLLLQYGTARLPANVTAVVMLSEVLFAALSAALLGAGVITLQTAGGGLLIVLASLAATLSGSAGKPRPASGTSQPMGGA